MKSGDSHKSPLCLKCNDSNVTVEKSSDSKIDYYKGSPPFPQNGNKDGELDWMLYGVGGD